MSKELLMDDLGDDGAFDDTLLDLSGRSLDAIIESSDEDAAAESPSLIWWLAQLAMSDRALYERIRSVAWMLVAENLDRLVVPN